ncbi:MAG: hypothetical protein O6840_05715 [Nitrospirae bacterium]|nr:hypothetical protein [Nitrospirota bacterium]
MDILIGSNQLRNTNGIFVAQEQEFIKLEFGENDSGLLLTMNLYNPTGTQVAKLERNTWVSNDQDRFELNAGPESVMLVDNTLKGVVILLKIEDHNRITIPQAKFYLPSGRVSEVTADGWQVGNTIELKGTDIDLDGGVIEIQ